MIMTDMSYDMSLIQAAIKPLRWFKIARIMKLGKAGPIIDLIMDYWSISPIGGKTIMVMVTLIITIHIVSCIWWLWKVLGMSVEETNNFLDAQSWSQERQDLSTPFGKMEAYVISVYVTTMTLTTVGYGDISADNTSERVGYTFFFIVGAFIWGNLLAQLGELHASASARSQEKMEQVQTTLEFLNDNDCPRTLRSQIIQWTRFHGEHTNLNIKKKQMILNLPENLQKGLVRHLYANAVTRVPVFAYIESVDDTDTTIDAIQEKFLNDVFILFEYKTFTPGEILVNFSDGADRLIIFVSGKVDIQFEHPSIHRQQMTLKQGEFIGDMAILGDEDWANSTCFHLQPSDSDEPTEISVCTAPHEYVVVLELRAQDFQIVLQNSLPVTQAAVDHFIEKAKRAREAIACETDPLKIFRMKAIRRWESFVLAYNKSHQYKEALGANTEWNFAKNISDLAKRAQNDGSLHQHISLRTPSGGSMKHAEQTETNDVLGQDSRKMETKVDKILDAVSDIQTRLLSLERSHSLSHIKAMERVESIQARIDLVYLATAPLVTASTVYVPQPATNTSFSASANPQTSYSLPLVPGMQSTIPRSYAVQGRSRSQSRLRCDPFFVTQSMEVEMSMEQDRCDLLNVQCALRMSHEEDEEKCADGGSGESSGESR